MIEGSTFNAIAVDSSSNAYVIGTTREAEYPVTSTPVQKSNFEGILDNTTSYELGGSPTAVFTKLNPTGTALVYSTYLGGSGTNNYYAGDSGLALALDPSGNAYLLGATHSASFLVSDNAFQSANLSGNASFASAFVTRLALEPDASGAQTVAALSYKTTSSTPIFGVPVTFTAIVGSPLALAAEMSDGVSPTTQTLTFGPPRLRAFARALPIMSERTA